MVNHKGEGERASTNHSSVGEKIGMACRWGGGGGGGGRVRERKQKGVQDRSSLYSTSCGWKSWTN